MEGLGSGAEPFRSLKQVGRILDLLWDQYQRSWDGILHPAAVREFGNLLALLLYLSTSGGRALFVSLSADLCLSKTA